MSRFHKFSTLFHKFVMCISVCSSSGVKWSSSAARVKSGHWRDEGGQRTEFHGQEFISSLSFSLSSSLSPSLPLSLSLSICPYLSLCYISLCLCLFLSLSLSFSLFLSVSLSVCLSVSLSCIPLFQVACLSAESACIRPDITPEDYVAIPPSLWRAFLRWHGSLQSVSI